MKAFLRILCILFLATIVLPELAGQHPDQVHASPISVITSCDETLLSTTITEATSGAIIKFNLGLPCIFTLTEGPIVITKNVTIDASTSLYPVMISGGYRLPIFRVNKNATAVFNGLTIMQGHNSNGPGGGILNYGTVRISNSTFAYNSVTGDNDGGGLANYGTASISNSTFTDNSANYGAGIANLTPAKTNTVRINTSTFVHNSATVGAGIGNVGTMSVSNSTFAYNSADLGAGIANGVTISISNSTITNNAANRGAALSNASIADISSSTIANNLSPLGSIIEDDYLIRIGHSIVANSATFGACSLTSPSANIIDQGYNLDSTVGCNLTARTSLHTDDPKLDLSPANHGGPTPTLALKPDSPALNRIPPSQCLVPTDQRGVPRPQGSACDIGAFELTV
ncbi:MAG TPA: right-handed parallel beta-helix repeat-containing protein, partial [Ktedonobacteraceae bacterium]